MIALIRSSFWMISTHPVRHHNQDLPFGLKGETLPSLNLTPSGEAETGPSHVRYPTLHRVPSSRFVIASPSPVPHVSRLDLIDSSKIFPSDPQDTDLSRFHGTTHWAEAESASHPAELKALREVMKMSEVCRGPLTTAHRDIHNDRQFLSTVSFR
jgi:hypothetical protein